MKGSNLPWCDDMIRADTDPTLRLWTSDDGENEIKGPKRSIERGYGCGDGNGVHANRDIAHAWHVGIDRFRGIIVVRDDATGIVCTDGSTRMKLSKYISGRSVWFIVHSMCHSQSQRIAQSECYRC